MSYLAPEYKELEKKLAPFIEEHELDEVTVNSLIRGSIEVFETEVPSASTAVINTRDFGASVSVKAKNIKVNLKFAFSSIFFFKSVCDTNGIWLILSILNAIVLLIEDMKIQLSPREAIVLFALYRLRNADEETIYMYVHDMKEANVADITLQDVQSALVCLEKIGTIKMIDGKYCMCEAILIRSV